MNKKNQTYIEYFTRDGDRWDSLAYRYYADVRLQTKLIEENRKLFNGFAVPAILPAGLTIKIPLLTKKTTVDDSLLPPWKKRGRGL